jgi:parallel beta-helix repeat protein
VIDLAIMMKGVSHVSIVNCSFASGFAIEMTGCQDVDIDNNDFSGGIWTISCQESKYAFIFDNFFLNGYIGIYAVASEELHISRNTFLQQTNSSIYLDNSDRNRIRGNNFQQVEICGVWMHSSDENILLENHYLQNWKLDILITSDSIDNDYSGDLAAGVKVKDDNQAFNAEEDTMFVCLAIISVIVIVITVIIFYIYHAQKEGLRTQKATKFDRFLHRFKRNSPPDDDLEAYKKYKVNLDDPKWNPIALMKNPHYWNTGLKVLTTVKLAFISCVFFIFAMYFLIETLPIYAWYFDMDAVKAQFLDDFMEYNKTSILPSGMLFLFFSIALGISMIFGVWHANSREQPSSHAWKGIFKRRVSWVASIVYIVALFLFMPLSGSTVNETVFSIFVFTLFFCALTSMIAIYSVYSRRIVSIGRLHYALSQLFHNLHHLKKEPVGGDVKSIAHFLNEFLKEEQGIYIKNQDEAIKRLIEVSLGSHHIDHGHPFISLKDKVIFQGFLDWDEQLVLLILKRCSIKMEFQAVNVKSMLKDKSNLIAWNIVVLVINFVITWMLKQFFL